MGSRSRKIIVVLLVLVLSLDIVNSRKKPKLEIISESKPDDCTEGAQAGDKLSLHYTGSFTNGKVFDSSHGRDPFSIQLGAKQVIPGWEQGLVGMCEGEIRKLKIPPHLAYGERGIEGAIPGGATLLFTVELLSIQKPSAFTLNRDTLNLLGGVALIGAIIFAAFRRFRKESEEIQQKKAAKKAAKKKK